MADRRREPGQDLLQEPDEVTAIPAHERRGSERRQAPPHLASLLNLVSTLRTATPPHRLAVQTI